MDAPRCEYKMCYYSFSLHQTVFMAILGNKFIGEFWFLQKNGSIILFMQNINFKEHVFELFVRS